MRPAQADANRKAGRDKFSLCAGPPQGHCRPQMTDHTRMVFDRLQAAGTPDAQQRASIYEHCRSEIAAAYKDPLARADALERLEKVIRRQEMQALYEETMRAR